MADEVLLVRLARLEQRVEELEGRPRYTCPVCAYDGLTDPPANYEICPCCGTEFGYTDFTRTHEELRAAWIAGGCVWWSQNDGDPRPAGWSPKGQLERLTKGASKV